jgi:hypothetical protein
MAAKSGWPKGVEPISFMDLGRLGVDAERRLYWDGEPVRIRQRIGLSFWQKVGVGLTVASAVVVAFFTALSYFMPTA